MDCQIERGLCRRRNRLGYWGSFVGSRNIGLVGSELESGLERLRCRGWRRGRPRMD